MTYLKSTVLKEPYDPIGGHLSHFPVSVNLLDLTGRQFALLLRGMVFIEQTDHSEGHICGHPEAVHVEAVKENLLEALQRQHL